MRRNCRSALSLIEMLVAMVVTLIMMGGVVTLFGTVGNSVSDSRAVIEISERLRYTRNRLQEDLSGVTVTMLPPRKPEAGEGYFEYIEGPRNDAKFLADPTLEGAGLQADTDDILMFTARTRDEPFAGRITIPDPVTGLPDTITQMINSHEAEIAWFVRQTGQAIPTSDGLGVGTIQLHTLYRRVRLISPTAISLNLYNEDDLSISPLNPQANINGNPRGNTLGDLTKRENRFLHLGNFPFEVAPPLPAFLAPDPTDAEQGKRYGEDVILTNVLSFDVQAWDPNAAVRVDANNIALTPSDRAYADTSVSADPFSNGCYVDLWYNRNLPPARQGNSWFSAKGSPVYLSHNAPQLTNPTYDTWSLHYENNGIDEDGSNGSDAGTNGIDDNGDGIVDDPDELDTLPPYPVPLRGIQVKIRVYEPDSRQVREVTLVQDFLPQ